MHIEKELFEYINKENQPSYPKQETFSFREIRETETLESFPADSFKSDQPRITRNALKSQIFDLFTKSSSGHKVLV